MNDCNKPTRSTDFDVELNSNESGNPYLGDMVSVRLSRRDVLGGGLGAGAAMVLGGFALTGCSDDNDPAATANSATPAQPTPKLGFSAVAKHTDDVVAVPEGYSWHVLYALGDPLDNATPDWAGDGSETGASYAMRAGDHHDGMSFFGLSTEGNWDAQESGRALLVINHENITNAYLHAGAPSGTPRDADEALKEINAHGVAVVEIQRKGDGTYRVVRDSTFNRRITPMTEMALHGPAAGSRFMVTVFDETGLAARGTINNCANGLTPWGTYLTCEENWAFYFKRDDDVTRSDAEDLLLRRYGIRDGNGGSYSWSTAGGDDVYARWDASTVGGNADDGADDYRNEPNTFGWVVEIDPFAPASIPRKRTALGRLGHEGAVFAPPVAGRPLVVYMGDDARYEYIYKFVSARDWDPADINGGLAAGDKYLDNGTLYVAKFDANGQGEWVELTHGRNGLTADNSIFPFTSQAAVLVATRLAADAVGATRMDRPEWGAVNPRNGEVYMTLTNNSRRGDGSASSSTWPESDTGEDVPVDAANPRSYDSATGSFTSSLNGNVHGHIIRWREDDGDHTAATFRWDVYVFAAPANAQLGGIFAGANVSLLNNNNDMSSPDGLWFDDRGLLWIQTGDGAYTDVTHCMMLAAVPGEVGDGTTFSFTTPTGTRKTHVGAEPGNNLRRFLVGPAGCEITGICLSPDYKAMFVNIQHPGEDGDLGSYDSNWPDGGVTDRPRSATIVITRDDGGEVGV